MVLFIYITRLASNEKINLTLKKSVNLILTLWTTYFILWTEKNSQPSIREEIIIIKSFNNIYSNPSIELILITIIYLLLTLIIVVKISNQFNAPVKNLITK